VNRILIVALLVFAIPSFSLGQEGVRQSRWRQLFNARDLSGWEHIGPGTFLVEKGLLRTEGGMGLLWFKAEKFGNCVIRVVYKTTSAASNSGVFIRIADTPNDEMFAVHHGYEVQIGDDDTDEYHRTGAIYSLGKARRVANKRVGEWNRMEITLRGAKVLVRLNGVLVTDFDPRQSVPPRKFDWEPQLGARPETGYIGLQNHDEGDAHVYFKEIRVRVL
jgi:hypothetical protein